MKFSYNWIQSFFSEKLPEPEKLAELLTTHSFEVEEVTPKGKDYILDIDILPNRASDCLSHFGIAREIAALLISNIKYQISKTQIKNQKGSLVVGIDDKNLCPRYTAYVIGGV
jgi:phenylalanyl-tRNA synthetase beta chain